MYENYIMGRILYSATSRQLFVWTKIGLYVAEVSKQLDHTFKYPIIIFQAIITIDKRSPKWVSGQYF
jgi:hypothetical protein